MYASPIIYPLSKIPAKWQWLAAINPMSSIIEAFRCMFLGTGSVSVGRKYALFGRTHRRKLAVLGVLLFQHVARTFVDFA